MSNKNNTQDIIGALSKTYTSTISVNTNVSNPLNLNKLGNLIGTSLALNSAATNMYGVNVKWFRSIPQKRSKDVLFLEWTLYNVEDCPLNINVIYDDTSYDEAALTYNMMGIEYNIPLTMSISILDWERVTNNDGTVPAKNDIVYVPQSNRLYEVVSMTPQKTVASQITYYKVNLQKYQSKTNRLLGDNLSNTIDTYTNSIESLFGEEIREEIKDAINDKQTSPHNSTFEKDSYKKISNKDSIISKELICDGHTISKSYYKNSIDNNILVSYKNIYDEVNKNDERTFSCIFNINIDDNKSNIKIDELLKKTINHHVYKCSLPYKENCKVVLFNNIMNIYGEYNTSKQELKISNNIIDIIGEEWYEDEKFNTNNTICNIISSNNFSIDIIGNSIILLKVKNKEYIFNNDNIFSPNNWYNVIIKMGKTSSIKIYNVTNKLKLIYEEDIITKKWDEFINEDYFILGSDINITNIRLYNSGIIENDKSIINVISYFVNDDSKLIISDNADIFFENSYYGTQR